MRAFLSVHDAGQNERASHMPPPPAAQMHLADRHALLGMDHPAFAHEQAGMFGNNVLP